jgi:phage nucleotide-binding protein
LTEIAEKEVLTPVTIGGLVPIRVGEFRRERKINMLIYGNPGVGKTILACSADDIPECRKVLHLDIEGGTMSVEKRYPKVEFIRITDWDQLWNIYNDLLRNAYDYSTIIIDNLSEAQKIGMKAIMDVAKLRDPDIEEEVPRQRDWGIILERMRLMVRAFRDLPTHTIITAHEKEETQQRTGLGIFKPSLSGKLANEVAGFFDVVVRMYVQEVDGESTRILATAASEDYIAKDRSDSLPEYMTNPTMQKIFQIMNGEIEK